MEACLQLTRKISPDIFVAGATIIVDSDSSTAPGHWQEGQRRNTNQSEDSSGALSRLRPLFPEDAAYSGAAACVGKPGGAIGEAAATALDYSTGGTSTGE